MLEKMYLNIVEFLEENINIVLAERLSSFLIQYGGLYN